jgi:hypothetical protein
MEDWKDQIASRLRDRKSKEDNVERVIAQVENTLKDLLEELKNEYNIKVSVKEIMKKETEWIIKIEDHEEVLNSNILKSYLTQQNDLRNALISFIVDKFQFN